MPWHLARMKLGHFSMHPSYERTRLLAVAGAAPKKNALGRSRGGFSTKIHAVVDTFGRPLHLVISPGQAHDSTISSLLLPHVIGRACIADTAYDSDKFRAQIAALGIKAVIPNHPARLKRFSLNRRLYQKRVNVEHLFHHLKRFRRAATRYEKTSQNFLAILYAACIWLWAISRRPLVIQERKATVVQMRHVH